MVHAFAWNESTPTAQLCSIQPCKSHSDSEFVNHLLSSFMLTSLLAMSGFALAGAITPGPVNVLALRHGTQPQRSVAWLYVLGASVSYAVVVWVMGQSGQLLLRIPVLAASAPWICAIYLLWLAWRVATAPVSSPSSQEQDTPPLRPMQAFAQGAAVQALNPKAWLVALSGVGMFVIPLTARGTAAASALAWFCGISLLACLVGIGCWAILGKVLARWLQTPRRQRIFNGLLAALLACSVLGVLA